jgi:hypothetical protein
MEKTNLNVDRLLTALSVILSERSGLDVTVRKGEKTNDICSIQEISRLAE